MELHKTLSDALREHQGMVMLSILKEAHASGVTREHALEVLNLLFNEADASGDEVAENIIVDLMDILKFYCHPKDYIWKPETETGSGLNGP